MFSFTATAFLAGGIFIALQTLVAERVSAAWRSIVLTIPSTMALGLLFVGLTKSPHDVVEVARIIPAGLGPDYLFVMIFALTARFGFFVSLVSSFSIWAIGAWIILMYPPESFTTSIFIYGLPAIILAYFVVRRFSHETKIKPYPMTPRQIALRALIGGSVISLIVILSNTLGNIWGGIFSAFPAAFSATFIIYYFLQGAKSIPTVAKSMFFPGAIGFMVYCWIAAQTFELLGVWLGTLACYAGTFVFFWLFMKLQRLGLSFSLDLLP